MIQNSSLEFEKDFMLKHGLKIGVGKSSHFKIFLSIFFFVPNNLLSLFRNSISIFFLFSQNQYCPILKIFIKWYGNELENDLLSTRRYFQIFQDKAKKSNAKSENMTNKKKSRKINGQKPRTKWKRWVIIKLELIKKSTENVKGTLVTKIIFGYPRTITVALQRVKSQRVAYLIWRTSGGPLSGAIIHQ